MNTFGEWLRAALKENEMTQGQLAELLDTTESVISRWVTGARIPHLKTMELILKYFNCHIEIVRNKSNGKGLYSQENGTDH